MTQRSVLQIQILEKLGAPLLAAASEITARQQGDGQPRKQEAEMVAEMMGKAVQASVGLSGNMDMKDAGAQGDSIRLALAAMAGQIIAGQCRITGKIPAENDIKRMIKALEAVLAFSDNFTAAPENAARLEALEATSFPLDENQINIQYMTAFIPVINAVAAFSFGRPEARLVQEIADRLVRRALALRAKLPGAAADGGGADRKEALAILPGLCRLYAECHREETAKLMGLDAAARAKAAEASGGLLPMEPVWRAFEMKTAMLEALATVRMAGNSAVSPAVPAVPAAPQAAQQGQASLPPVQPPPAQPTSPLASFVAKPALAEEQAAIAESAVLPGAEPVSGGAAGTGGAYNPMGFFKARPKTQDEESGREEK